jgi:uncharacterized protein
VIQSAVKFLRKRWQRILLATVILVTFVAISLVFWAGSEIAKPPRRPLHDYHQEYLTQPAAHGIVIEKYTTLDGTPCLVCFPEPSGNFAERGNKLRQQLTARGITLRPAAEIVGTLVLLHGRKGRKEDYLPIAERFCAAGFRCVIPDLPAHGDHPHPLATYGVREAELPARVLAETAQHFSFEAQPAGLLGMSMGGSVAMHAAACQDGPWKSLIIIASFDSFSQVIEAQASQKIGTLLGPILARGIDEIYHRKTGIHLADIEPRKHAASITIPTLIAHGTADRVASLQAGKKLFDSLPDTTTKRWLEIPAAGHDNVLITDFPLYAELSSWMLTYVSNEKD